MNNITIYNGWICQIEDNQVTPVFGDIIIREGKILDIHQSDYDSYLRKSIPKIKNGLDIAGRVITVPLVNFHDHFYSRLAKGLTINGPMDNFVHILENLWWKLDRSLDLEMVKACAQMAVLESIRTGVTYIFDHHASPNHTHKSLHTVVEVLSKFDLHGVLCFEISDRNGPEKTKKAINENLRVLKSTNKNIKGMLGLHAPFTLNDSTLNQISQVLNDYLTGIHIHIGEDQYDIDFNQEKFKLSPVERLQKFSLLNDRSILVHGIHLSKRDYKIISKSGAALAYNPDSNLNNAVGLPEYANVPTQIPILVGTDGMHANISRSLKQLFLLYRHQKNEIDKTFSWIKKIYFDQLRFTKKYFPDFPRLKPDDQANIIIWDYVPPTPFSLYNFWGHYIYGILERPIHSVLNNGKFLLKNFKFCYPELNNINLNIINQGTRLAKKFLHR
jgi:cytosine/adenosine deaminase-related metal-dependent hydrolase